MIPSASIQQYRNKEEVDQPTRNFKFVTTMLFPLIEEVGNAGNAANFKVLPAPVRWDGVEFVGAKVALVGFRSAFS